MFVVPFVQDKFLPWETNKNKTLNLCHSADLHGFLPRRCLDVNPVFIPETSDIAAVPHPSHRSISSFPQQTRQYCKRSVSRFTVDKGGCIVGNYMTEGGQGGVEWKLHLLEPNLCRSVRLDVAAVLWNPGILAFHSSSSGCRSARSWRETWLKGETDGTHGVKEG